MRDHRARDTVTRASLLIKIRDSGDRNAWQEFDRIYRPMLRRFALARGLDSADADDVTQQCMAAVHKHITSFKYDPTKGRFKSWLRTLANNRIRNLHRARRPQRAESEDFEQEQEREKAPDEVFEQLWLSAHLKYCLQQIRSEVGSVGFRAYKLYVIDEWPVTKVCKELDLTPGQVYKIKWRVTRRIREIMTEHLGSDELLET